MVSAMINAVAAMTGGMIWPPLEAQASTAPAKAGGKPTFFIRGMVKVPVVTTLPAALPLTVPMVAEETTAALAGPPCIFPVATSAKSMNSSPAPVWIIREPKRTNRKM